MDVSALVETLGRQAGTRVTSHSSVLGTHARLHINIVKVYSRRGYRVVPYVEDSLTMSSDAFL